MPIIDTLFVTKVYRDEMSDARSEHLLAEIETACLSIAQDDEAGQRWCEKNGYPGYTSYASLNALPWRIPVFGDLRKALASTEPDGASVLETRAGGYSLLVDGSRIDAHRFEATVKHLAPSDTLRSTEKLSAALSGRDRGGPQAQQ